MTVSAEGALWYTHREPQGWQTPQKIHWAGGDSVLALHPDGYPRVAFLTGDYVYYATAREAVAPLADFTAQPTHGPAPLAVQFTNTTTGDYSECLWTFGDGITSTVDSPLYIYQSGGAYDVSLSVSGPVGDDAETKLRYISVQDGDASRVYLPVVLREY